MFVKRMSCISHIVTYLVMSTALIPGGLTSVIQVCDLIINKTFKQILRYKYYAWRRVYIRQKRAEGVQGKLNIKLPRDEMIGFIETTIKELNRRQLEKPTIRTMFRKVGQDPSIDCTQVNPNPNPDINHSLTHSWDSALTLTQF